MKAKSLKPRFVPVLRKKGGSAKIPYLKSSYQLQAARREEDRLARLAKGTTPQGRQLLRMILYSIEKAFLGNKPFGEVLAHVEEEIEIFSALRREWLLLLSRLWRFPRLIELERSTPRVIALFLVKREYLRWALIAKRRNGGQPFSDEHERTKVPGVGERVNAEDC